MSNKSLWILLLSAVVLLSGVIAWRVHQSHQATSVIAGQQVTNLNCVLGCNDSEVFNPKPASTNKTQIPAKTPVTQNNTCMEAVTNCLGQNGDLGHCAQQTSCSAACKLAIINVVMSQSGNRIDKLNELFILPDGACHAP